jgi:hypothetical protein
VEFVKEHRFAGACVPNQHHLKGIAHQLEMTAIYMQVCLRDKLRLPSHEVQPAIVPLHLYAKLTELTSPYWHSPMCMWSVIQLLSHDIGSPGGHGESSEVVDGELHVETARHHMDILISQARTTPHVNLTSCITRCQAAPCTTSLCLQ